MKRVAILVGRHLLLALPAAAVFLVVLLGASVAVAAGPNTGFGFNARDVAGFPG